MEIISNENRKKEAMRTIILKFTLTGEDEENYTDVHPDLVIEDFLLVRYKINASLEVVSDSAALTSGFDSFKEKP
jgi:hypothetical protein